MNKIDSITNKYLMEYIQKAIICREEKDSDGVIKNLISAIELFMKRT